MTAGGVPDDDRDLAASSTNGRMKDWAKVLDGKRHVGDEYGDWVVDSILAVLSPDQVDEHLVGLIDEIRSAERDGWGASESADASHRWARELGSKLEDAQFFAGTYSVLQGLKVARSSMKAAEVGFRHDDPETARGFVQQTIRTLEDARGNLEKIEREVAAGRHDRWYQPHSKREAYNRLLMLSEYLAFAPELLTAPGSHLSWHFSLLPDGFTEYFGPVPAPDWVDEEKLARATAVWDENMLFCLLVLFSGSLPYCYLDKKGIPLLYETGKLSRPKYVSQRLYETALMLDAVMSRGGIRVGHDVTHQRYRIEEAAESLGISVRFDRGGKPVWGDLSEADREALRKALVDLADGSEAGRFLSGRGVLYSRKVRLLHSAMRYMSLQVAEHVHAGDAAPRDESVRARWMTRFAEGEWAEQDHGIPINQEDLAYTLLTFSWVIPNGLSAWGRRPDPEEVEAFLHVWKVVGYLMGLEEELLTDDPEEAEALFHELVHRLSDGPAHDEHKPPNERMAAVLTGTIVEFLRNYLPKPLRGLPPVMIEKQVGKEHVADLLGPDDRPGPFARLFYAVVTLASRVHSLLTYVVYSRSPLLRSFYAELMHEVGMAFVDSWRGPFERRPFYLPQNLLQWKPDPGIRDRYEQELERWRRRMFNMLALGLITLLAGSVAVGVGIVGAFLQDGIHTFERSLFYSIPLFGASALIMRHMIRRTAHRRPVLDTPGQPPRVYPDR